MLTGETMSWVQMSVWVLSVALVGVVVAIGLRRQMLVVDALPFPGGVATGQTLKEIYAKGAEAMARVKMLLAGMVLGGVSKLLEVTKVTAKLAFPGALGVKEGGVVAGKGHTAITLKNLGFALDPSLMMIAVGAIIGIRAAASDAGRHPRLVRLRPAGPGAGLGRAWAVGLDAGWFGATIKWMLWPGVAIWSPRR